MESRKIQRVGASSLAVSLPNDWVKDVGLDKGDLVFFTEDEGGSLKLMTAKQTEKKPVTTVQVDAEFCKDPELLGRVIIGIYSLGHDSIKLVSAKRLNTEQVNKIRDVTQKLMGMGIMEETPNSLLIQCSIDTTKFPINTLLRRLFIISSTMHREVIDALPGFDTKLADAAISRKQEADTMFWVIVRLLNTCQRDKNIAHQMSIDTPSLIVWYRLIAQYLRLIAERAQKTAKKIVSLNQANDQIGPQLIEETIAINERAYALCHQAINSFFSSDIQAANQAIESYHEIQKVEEQLQERVCGSAYLRGKNFSVNKYFKGKGPIQPCAVAQISFIIWSGRRIAELGAELAETAIHRVLCKDTKMCKVNSKTY
ncbi:MAG: phosphate uptake regulator PhoU [Candidatus Bathyarchaeota archaeon]|nr:phosphate uptake regulator PhoU [Candidatus Bathyarchaeota archaeon]